MKTSTFICLVFFLIGAAVFLLQLWFPVWSHEIFAKIMITDGVLFIVCFIVNFLIKETKETESLTKNKGLD